MEVSQNEKTTTDSQHQIVPATVVKPLPPAQQVQKDNVEQVTELIPESSLVKEQESLQDETRHSC